MDPIASTPPQSVRISFEVTPTDLHRFSEWYVARDPRWVQWRRKARDRAKQYIVLSAIATAVAIGWIWFHWSEVVDRQESHHLLLALLPVWGWFYVNQIYRQLRTYSPDRVRQLRQTSAEYVSHAAGSYTIELSAEAFRADRPVRTVISRWAAMRSVDSTPDLIIISDEIGLHWPVPKSAFPDAVSAQRFVDAAEGFLRAASSGDANRLRAFLAERDFPCPKCKYNLHACTQPRCPECGTSLDRQSIPDAF